MTLTSVLIGTDIKDLFRALNSDKEYLKFEISVFNTGAVITVICTNNYKEINRNTWNGYDFIIENCNTTRYYIISTLKDLLKESPEKFNKKQIRIINKSII